MNANSGPNVVVAAFDFDGTFTKRDTLLPFLRFMSGRRKFFAGMMKVMPTLVRYSVGQMDNQKAKENVLGQFVAGNRSTDLIDIGNEFAIEKLPKMISSVAVDRLRWHQASGHRCLLISASLNLYLDPWARSMNFDDVLCSTLATSEDGTVSGKLDGTNCFGAEKVNRLYQKYPESEISELFAYGDSKGDKELLDVADHAYYRSFADKEK